MSVLKLIATTTSVVALSCVTHYAQKRVAEKMLIEGQFSEAEIQAARLGAVFTCTTLIGGPLDQLLNALFAKH